MQETKLTKQLEQQLFEQMSFLELTRQHPNQIEQSMSHQLDDGSVAELWDTGVLYFKPADNAAITNQHALVISSGVHGNETAPIEIVDNLVRSILSGELKVLQPVLFIIGNPVAMNESKRFIQENMNRLFCGKHRLYDHDEAKRAAYLEGYLQRFFDLHPTTLRYHYDLHTAIRGSKYKKFAIYPFQDGKDWNKEQLAFLLSSGIDTILLGHQPAGTFSYFSSHFFNAHSFTVELGKVMPFGQNEMENFQKISDNLAKLIANETIEMKPFNHQDFNLFRVKEELLKSEDPNYKLNVSSDALNFSDFPKGFKLTEDYLGGYTTENEGEAIVFPNLAVPAGQRAGLVVVRAEI